MSFGKEAVEQEIDEYITSFNEQRVVFSLIDHTPKQYREEHGS